MKASFERNIHYYNALAADEVRLSEAEEALPTDLEKEIELVIQRYGERSGSTKEAQSKVYNLQVEKQRIMHRLRQQLQQIDGLGEVERYTEGQLPVRWEEGVLICETAQGETEISEGDLLTDGEWGIEYAPNSSLPRSLRKRYYLETAKREIRELLDWQIYHDQLSHPTVHPGLSKAYSAAMIDRSEHHEPKGIILERLVRTFLKKFAINYHLDLEVVETDLYEDVTRKIDFIIQRTHHYRGVRVEENTELVSSPEERIGIQFTFNPTAENLSHKLQQIEYTRQKLKPIDLIKDLVLVLLTPVVANQIYEAYQYWKGGHAVGGPDTWWDTDTKQHVFKNLLRDVFPAEDIARMWEESQEEEGKSI